MDYIIFKTCIVFVSRRVAKNVHRKKPKQAQFSGKKIRYINFSDTTVPTSNLWRFIYNLINTNILLIFIIKAGQLYQYEKKYFLLLRLYGEKKIKTCVLKHGWDVIQGYIYLCNLTITYPPVKKTERTPLYTAILNYRYLVPTH